MKLHQHTTACGSPVYLLWSFQQTPRETPTIEFLKALPSFILFYFRSLAEVCFSSFGWGFLAPAVKHTGKVIIHPLYHHQIRFIFHSPFRKGADRLFITLFNVSNTFLKPLTTHEQVNTAIPGSCTYKHYPPPKSNYFARSMQLTPAHSWTQRLVKMLGSFHPC